MIKRQRILIIVLAAVFILAAAAYFIVIRPLTQNDDPEDTGIAVDPGEGTSGQRMLMFPRAERDDIESIEVTNTKGSYKFVYNDEIEDFELVGHETLAVNALMFARLVVSTGSTYVLAKVTDSVTDDELLQYGFKGDGAEPARFTVTLHNGTTHNVNVGKKVISGGGYYAMYEGRNAVYVLDANIEATVLAGVEDLLLPILTGGIEAGNYFYVDHFTIKHYGEDFLSCRNLTSEELSEMETTAQAQAITVIPNGYSLSTNYDETLQMLVSCEGESVAAIGVTDEHLEEYGLKDEPYTISYDYNGFEFELTVSEPTEDGYYYVATKMFDLIVKVPAADFEFLSWGLLQWIEPYVFSRSISFVESIEIESDELTETFRFTHRPGDDPSLIVVGDECGQIRDIPNFREFYKTLLYTKIYDYAPEDVEVTEDDCVLKFTVRTLGGNVTEYAFYRYSTRRCLLKINGEGQFYLFFDTANKIISDAGKAISGEPIDSLDKN